MKETKIHAIITAIALTFAGNTFADANFYFPLEGGQEVPPVATSASGSCEVTLTGLSVNVSCTFENLTSSATLSHIHAAPAGINGGVVLDLTPSAATSGTITGNGVLSAQQAADMEAGNMYINLHNEAYPAGEIRGQILPARKQTSIPSLSRWGSITLVTLLLLVGAGLMSNRHGAGKNY